MTSTPPHQWKLSRDAFEQLLERLGSEREAAAREYEAIRRKLIHFFDWRGALTPDIDADTTLDRVARKLQEGEAVENVNAYAHAVARHVWQESQRRSAKQRAALEEVARASPETAAADPLALQMRCLSACLARLPEDARSLVVAYYEGDGRIHLEERKTLADRLGLTYGTMKKRAHRARDVLRECLRRCLEGQKRGNR